MNRIYVYTCSCRCVCSFIPMSSVCCLSSLYHCSDQCKFDLTFCPTRFYSWTRTNGFYIYIILLLGLFLSILLAIIFIFLFLFFYPKKKKQNWIKHWSHHFFLYQIKDIRIRYSVLVQNCVSLQTQELREQLVAFLEHKWIKVWTFTNTHKTKVTQFYIENYHFSPPVLLL